MSQIVFSKAFDMLESQDWAYNITKSTSSTLTLQGRANSLTIHGDLNYWLDGVHGEISSATYSTNGSIAYELTVAGSLDAHKMQSLLEAGDTQALYAHILGGNDLLDASASSGAQTLLGYNGNDRIEAGIDNDVLLGGNGNDVLLGQLGNDTLRGGADNDSLYGGVGNDTLVGGAGNDRFIFNGTKMGLDTITDFDVTADTIVLFSGNAQTFQNLGNTSGELAGRFFAANGKGNAMDSNDHILFDTNSGELYYDADGNGAGAKVQFGVVGLSAGQTLSAADFAVEYFGLA